MKFELYTYSVNNTQTDQDDLANKITTGTQKNLQFSAADLKGGGWGVDHISPSFLFLLNTHWLVGWLIVLRFFLALTIFQSYLDLKAGDNQSLIFKWRGRDSNLASLAPQIKSFTLNHHRSNTHFGDWPLSYGRRYEVSETTWKLLSKYVGSVTVLSVTRSSVPFLRQLSSTSITFVDITILYKIRHKTGTNAP